MRNARIYPGLDALLDELLIGEEDKLAFDDEPFEPFPPATLPAAGRDDPFPCGSGKKYRKCHLDADRG